MTAMKRAGRTGSAILPSVLCTLLAAVPAVAAPGAGQTATPPTWGSCDRFISDTYLPAAQCTTVPVPIDDANPAGPQAQLAVVKIPASGERLGVLLMNPGGPGASAVDAVVNLSDSLAGSAIERSGC